MYRTTLISGDKMVPSRNYETFTAAREAQALVVDMVAPLGIICTVQIDVLIEDENCWTRVAKTKVYLS